MGLTPYLEPETIEWQASVIHAIGQHGPQTSQRNKTEFQSALDNTGATGTTRHQDDSEAGSLIARLATAETPTCRV